MIQFLLSPPPAFQEEIGEDLSQLFFYDMQI